MGEARDMWMVGDVLEAMSGTKIPPFIVNAVQEVQAWLSAALTEDAFMEPADLISSNDRQVSADLEYLFNRL